MNHTTPNALTSDIVNPLAFAFEGHNIRTVSVNGDPWFVAKDIADALGYSWNANKTIGHVPAEWRGVESVSTPSGPQEMLVLSEHGMYFFPIREVFESLEQAA